MARESAPSSAGPELPKLTRFEVVRRLGEGGAGLVYEVIDRDRDHGGRLALKMLRVLDGEMLLRLKEEFRSLQDIEHPNLIRLFELSCEAEAWFFTMELIDGGNFLAHATGEVDRVAARSGVRGEEAAPSLPAAGGDTLHGARSHSSVRAPRVTDMDLLRGLLLQLARGLVALHAAGKVHRDIKPSNVLVAKDGRVVILDLGLVQDAAADKSVVEDDLVVGTISYMAPEQAAGSDVGPAADWYSVGAVLYQCLTGRPPFEGGIDVLQRKQVEDPPRPSESAAGMPADLDALCMDLLERDPEKRPSGGDVVRRLEARGASVRPDKKSVLPGQVPFVGRAREIETLHGAFDRARKGTAVTVLVEGESGVGKSAMVRRFTKALQEEEDVLVLSGRCYEREDVPYKAIDGVIDSLSIHLSSLSSRRVQAILPPTAFILAHVFPVLRRVPGTELGPKVEVGAAAERRSLLFRALRELFENLARARPLVVVIDDLQWADADSLALLGEILRAPAPAMLLVATARLARDSTRTATTGGASSAMAPFGLPGEVRVLPLSGLTPEEGLELVTMLGGDMPSGVARRIAQEAGGHPLFVDELVRHAQLQGGEAPSTVVLDDALVARVARLDEGARSLLELLAVAGVALPQDLAMRAAGLSFDDFAKLAQTLRAAHLARTHGWRGADAIEPYHDRVREAVAARLDSDARKGWHAKIAGALEQAQAKDADALSLHWLGAGDDAKAGAYAQVAADQAASALAYERAARLYDRAIELAVLSEADKQALRLKKAEALTSAGRGRDAAKAYFDAAVHASPDRALDLRRLAAEGLLTAGRFDEGDEALRGVLREVGIGMPRTPLVALLGLLFFRFVLFLRGIGFRERREDEIPLGELTRLDACMGVGRVLSVVDTIRGAYFQTRGLLYALAAGELRRLSYSLAIEGVYVATPGTARNAARSRELVAQARSVAARSGDAPAQALVETATGYANFVLGRFAEALADNDRGIKKLRDDSPGAFWDVRSAQLGAIWAVGWMGQLNELASRVERLGREAEQRGDTYLLATIRTGVPNLTWLRKGAVQTARANVLDATKQWTQRGYHSQHYWSLLALTRVDLYEGDVRAAYARVAREWSQIRRALILEVRVMGVEARHLRASTALAVASESRGSEREKMLREAERDADALASRRWALGTPFAQLVRACATAMRGDTERAAVALDASARGFDEVDMSLHAASARWHLGKLRGGVEGRALVSAAESWAAAEGVVEMPRLAAVLAPGLAQATRR